MLLDTIAIVILAGLFGWRRTSDGLVAAAKDCAQLVAVCACAGIIVGVIALTGIGGRFSQMLLDLAGARRAIERHIAAPLGLSVEQAALGMYRVINTNMAQGVREVTIKRGFDLIMLTSDVACLTAGARRQLDDLKTALA